MTRRTRLARLRPGLSLLCLAGLLLGACPENRVQAAQAALLGWNNLGMHCMDSDYSVFSILPPYNTIEAQLIVGGKLVKDGMGYTVTYEAIPDPTGSINKTSHGKGNWATYGPLIYGSDPDPDLGLAGWDMPGANNVPQGMLFEAANTPAPNVSTPVNWFRAEGIPITPIDDAGVENPYPMMRLTARDSANKVIATSDIVLPVSDEMDCRACHGANTQAAAMPAGGWITNPVAGREYRLNILKLHDDREFVKHPALYADALASKHFSPSGLYVTAVGGQPILCAACHASEALGTASFSSANGKVPPLTASIHSLHASVQDPLTGMTLNDTSNRTGCYRCHPGSATRCLRGAMGSAIAPDGTMAMQCQSCHGSMSQVGAPERVGWFMEPNCQSCHTGTATSNNGQIRYTSVFDSTGKERVAVNKTFATTADTPAAGISLYRFSVGHGGLQCSACHGSTHAEFPAAHPNDNMRNIKLQGHAGVTIECTACHTTMPDSLSGASGGPHGMHPIGQDWVDRHHDAVSDSTLGACKACHGVDSRGTVLSRVQGDRTFNVGDSGAQKFYRGATIGCYTCHEGPSSSSMNNSAPPAIADVFAETVAGVDVDMVLPVSNANATLRIISQPENGSVGLVGNVATYFPFDGFTGADTFTFAAYDGAKNSALATGTVQVGAAVTITAQPVSKTVAEGTSVTLSVTATGYPDVGYQWYKDTELIHGATGSSITFAPVAQSDAGSYYVVVSNSQGAVTSTPAILTVTFPPPTISSISPTSGPVGATVTIKGTYFTGVTAVNFNGTAASTFTVVSATQIMAIVPAGATTGKITVTTVGGIATSGSTFAVVAQPTISGFTPASGPVTTQVTITGSGFAGAVTVEFNGVASTSVNLVTATQLTAIVPATATSGPITVTTAGGIVTSATSFKVTPTISGFSPASGGVGTAVTITGTGFTGTTSVTLNGKAVAVFSFISPATLVVGVPSGATSGKFAVTTAGGTATSSSNFSASTAFVKPTIKSLSVTTGPVETVVTITGKNLGAATAVSVGATPLTTWTVLSATQIKVSIPNSGKVSVTTPGGSATSTSSFTVK